MFLALKEIMHSLRRYILITSIIALIAYLTFFLSSLAYGLAKSNRTAIDEFASDTFLIAESANKSLPGSVFDYSIYEEVKAENKAPLNVYLGVVVLNTDPNKKNNVAFMGVEQDSFIAPEIVEGRMFNTNNEVVVSESLKEEFDYKIGDELKVLRNGRVFEIVGFTKSAKYNTAPVIYTTLIMSSQAMMSYTTGDPTYDATAGPTINMPNRISAVVIRGAYEMPSVTGLVSYSTSDIIASIPGYQAQVLTFSLMIGFLVGISVLIIAIFLYILTLQKKQNFGVLKVRGISNGYIARSVLYQTLILTITGLLVGFILAIITVIALPASIPLGISWLIYGLVILAMLVFAEIGALFSVRSVVKIDPLEALK